MGWPIHLRFTLSLVSNTVTDCCIMFLYCIFDFPQANTTITKPIDNLNLDDVSAKIASGTNKAFTAL